MKITLTPNRDRVPTTYDLHITLPQGGSVTLWHLTSEDVLNISYGVASAWNRQVSEATGHTTQSELDREAERLGQWEGDDENEEERGE